MDDSLLKVLKFNNDNVLFCVCCPVWTETLITISNDSKISRRLTSLRDVMKYKWFCHNQFFLGIIDIHNIANVAFCVFKFRKCDKCDISSF